MKIGIFLMSYVQPSGVPIGWEHKLVPAGESAADVDRIGHHHNHNEKLPYSNLYGDVMLTPLQEELFRSISNGSRNIASFSPGKYRHRNWTTTTTTNEKTRNTPFKSKINLGKAKPN